ncbi:ribosome maturation factor RimP [Loigolactobacillus backii]|uniref:Ribosome maturation factor RimP n=1 Tax=Loigolactobacillus backii TaxID=375175 RepID=A0A192H338_9LACO|nr:ribosome maturation factor RimP [Loigolactobacillus backii]ANK59654.1 ribosome maturation factor [Loigolactobacillus backii]ANK62780.1 ribosome maturation factor [Loigolactobacillus backii]ANK64648.1 ribosome maturation factor [Loigolactobacillus backii]ANK66956.1 ribosome maturation factor RimP [Loigolactobacillus backii]ANK70212.1 ribosome maturation factor [Loigolactobacillus backii]
MSSVIETVQDVVTPIVSDLHVELVDIEFVKEGKSWYLRVYIDKPGGIDIEECALVSEKVSEQLDAMDPDPIPQAYFLEVSSPGAERPLKKEADYQRAIGDYIHISLYQPVAGAKIYEGTLKSVSADELTLDIKIKTRHKEMTFDRKKIAQARLAIEF